MSEFQDLGFSGSSSFVMMLLIVSDEILDQVRRMRKVY